MPVGACGDGARIVRCSEPDEHNPLIRIIETRTAQSWPPYAGSCNGRRPSPAEAWAYPDRAVGVCIATTSTWTSPSGPL